MGKSTLVRQWQTTAREQASVVTAFLDDDVHDAIEAMEAVSARLGQQGHPLKKFDKQLALYRQRRHQAESATPAPAPVPGEPGAAEPGQGVASPSSVLAAQVGLVGLGMLPGVGAFTGAVDPQQVAMGADRVRSMLTMRLRSHEDVQLVMHPVAGLTPVFLDDLAEVSERCERVVLFFDVYERTGPVLDAWLHGVVFGEEYGSLPVNVQLVLSGQLRLDPQVWGNRLGYVTEVHLDVFSEEEARTLLATHGVTDGPSVELVLRLSGRLPLLVDMLARSESSDSGTGDGIADPSETAVERFLRWEPDTARREAALVCALPLQLDEDVYRAAVPDEAAAGYAWLRGLAFVGAQAGRCRYHDVVRAAMLRLQRTRSPARWQRAHTRLADVFEQWRLEAEADLGPDSDECWGDGAWREHRLNETYHRLCANPRAALPDALFQTVHATGVDVATQRRWSQVFVQAGNDTETPALTSWGNRLEAAGEQEGAGDAVPTMLLSAPELDSRGRALAYAVRASRRRASGAYEDALADYTAALALAPGDARALTGRAVAYRLMNRYEEALADCTSAIEAAPRSDRALATRGEVYRLLGRHEEALEDFARALDIDPQDAWGHAHRGQTYEAAGRYEEAAACFTRAIEILPDYAWALGCRGYTYQCMGRHADAIVDFTRSLEIDPEETWTIGMRGAAYRSDARYEEALADFTHALEIEPHREWARVGRGLTFKLAERYDEALADYTRAIEVDRESDGQVAHALRGEVYRELGRYEEALTDFDRAVALDPEDAWSIASRAQAHLALGRPEEALAGCSRALEIGPRSDWMVYGRAQALLLLGRHDEALADCVTVLAIDPDDGWNVSLYAVALRLTGDEQAAGEQLRRAAELFGAAAARPGRRGALACESQFIAHCAADDWEAASAALDALLGLEPSASVIREALEDLSFLREILPAVAEGVAPFEQRLRETRRQGCS
ncbi:tetratricopeptide repeat protein [Streptomyces pratensis]|uniref:tetratricopeptide repeat protein n=1 Tax=Streptomyces pratensis TaxID=1169025 RepID=UPI0036374BB4